jgi:hypothetical protein
MVAMQYPARTQEIADRQARLDRLAAAYGTDHLSIPDLVRSLQTNPGLGFYLYSGDLDSMVPKETFADEVAEAGARLTYRDFANSGHDGFYSEHQVALDVFR